MREHLPATRNAVNHKFTIGATEGYLNVGFYDDGRPGEIFIHVQKEGSTLGGAMDSFAILFSLGLQYGLPLANLCDKLMYQHYEPSGITTNPQIPEAKSITDYIVKYLKLHYIHNEPS